MNEKYPLVSIIIVNWNGGEVFRDCLKSLETLKYPLWELIVVDNGSVDGSDNFPKEYHLSCSKLTLINNKDNLGFAKANNQGVKQTHGKYILLLNNDTQVTPEFLDLLVAKLEADNSIGVIQPKIYALDYPTHLDNAGSFLTYTGFLQHWGYMEKDSSVFNKECFIFSAKGACMLIKRSIIEKVALFDDSFGSYFEETDFCWRVWLLGFKVLYYPRSHIYHKIGFSSKKQNQIQINYHSTKNRIMSLIKNLSLFNILTIGLLHLILNLLLSLYYLLKFQFPKSLMITNAFIYNLINLPSTLDKRRFIQAFRIRSDQEIFKYILKPTSLSSMFKHFLKVEANFK